MELLWSNLSLGGLYTDTNADNDNDTQQTEHDCIGSLPNEPKSSDPQSCSNYHKKGIFTSVQEIPNFCVPIIISQLWN